AAQGTSGASGFIKAGLSLEMPGSFISKKMMPKKVQMALDAGDINEDDLNYIIRPLLRTFIRVGLFEEDERPFEKISNILEHQEIAQQIAEEGIVLFKNDSNFLPLELDKLKKIAILGPNAKKIYGKPWYGGSSAVVPPKFINPYDGIANYVSGKAEIVDNPEDADVVFLIVGFDQHSLFRMLLAPKEGDNEGVDRKHYSLPKKQLKLIIKTLEKNPNTVIILIAGNPVGVSEFYKNAPVILNAWNPGMMGGIALARVLFGDVTPSGKLPVTLPKKIEDHPAHKSKKRFPGDLKELKIYFDEGIYIGYRYFDEYQIEPLIPFGFGLSYTNFELSNIQLDKTNLQGSGSFTVSVDVKNIGDRSGAEIVQIYVGDDECSLDRPPKELQGFDKVYLDPGEKKTISITLNESAFEFYSEQEHKFKAETGSFTIWAGSSSRDLPLSIKINYTI
ncbi:MAG: glycoside hydrolase family 3 C-terminal domain-containing protein, partial [Candidatus Hodarchaeota archaeon]